MILGRGRAHRLRFPAWGLRSQVQDGPSSRGPAPPPASQPPAPWASPACPLPQPTVAAAACPQAFLPPPKPSQASPFFPAPLLPGKSLPALHLLPGTNAHCSSSLPSSKCELFHHQLRVDRLSHHFGGLNSCCQQFLSAPKKIGH